MHRGACTGASQAGNRPPLAAPDEEMDEESPAPAAVPAAVDVEAWEPEREREWALLIAWCVVSMTGVD